MLVEEQNCHAQCWLKGLHLLPLAAYGAVCPYTRVEFISLCCFFIGLGGFFPSARHSFFTASCRQSVEKEPHCEL